jgi:hypothetical protein
MISQLVFARRSITALILVAFDLVVVCVYICLVFLVVGFLVGGDCSPPVVG